MKLHEMTENPDSNAQQDERVVAAVRSGGIERYRELVERHERSVYGVAWSRLGDAALAEEVTQEAFIRAYRRLWLLGDGAKFAGWVNSIARRVAINLGIRHRRELQKRERWGLEVQEKSGAQSPELDPRLTPESLRRMVAEMPAGHRECLVLFYLEGKSGAETAAALGISEAALRVRLHRARAIMRERLEENLEGSLGKLRPAKTLVPAIMVGVLASSTAKAASAGAAGVTLGRSLAKFTPFKWVFSALLSVPMILSALLMPFMGLLERWERRSEQQNYLDAKGFRARLHRQFSQKSLSLFMLLAGLAFLVPAGFLVLPSKLGDMVGIKGFFMVVAAFTFCGAAALFRLREINRSVSRSLFLCGALVESIVFLCTALGWLPVNTAGLSIGFFALACIWINLRRSSGLRMDGNLFLRAVQGILPPADPTSLDPSPSRLDRASLRAFARYLGERDLVVDFRWEPTGLTLSLPPVPSAPFARHRKHLFEPAASQSRITLEWDGLVTAHCGAEDAAVLEAMRTRSATELAQLEIHVALAASRAWKEFRDGQLSAADLAAGQIPDEKIFVVPQSRIRAKRFQAAFGTVSCLVYLAMIWPMPEWHSAMRPVSVTEAQVRAALKSFDQEREGYSLKGGLLHNFLTDGFVLPSTRLIGSEVIQTIREEVFGFAAFDPNASLESRNTRLARSAANDVWLLQKAVDGGWVTLDEMGLESGQLSAALQRTTLAGSNYNFELSRRECNQDVTPYTIEVVDSVNLEQLRWLQKLNCLNLMKREKIITQIAALQVRSGEASAGRPPLPDWQAERGLFFVTGYPTLEDTYRSLAALEILAGLDRIDREACVQAILKLHCGSGFFAPPDSEGNWRWRINGGARDTFCAFESLRILGALNQVKDLSQWQFRVASYWSSRQNKNGSHFATWEEIEAWVCRQRMEKILHNAKENPGQPVSSLLQSLD